MHLGNTRYAELEYKAEAGFVSSAKHSYEYMHRRWDKPIRAGREVQCTQPKLGVPRFTGEADYNEPLD